jgi:hypothetical protein
MADSKVEDIKSDLKLKGKSNFVIWRRDFERKAKQADILGFLKGENEVPAKPQKEDYFNQVIKVLSRRSTRARNN